MFSCAHFAFSGYSKWVEYLVDHKADVNVTNKFGMTPLVLAVRHAYPHLVLYLLSHGANPHHQNHTRQTALHYASCAGEYNVLVTLCFLNPIKSTEFVVAYMLLAQISTILLVTFCFLLRRVQFSWLHCASCSGEYNFGGYIMLRA